MSSVSYTLLDGEWPILGPATPVPSSVLDAISSDFNGSAITSNLGYLSLGQFFIDVDLLQQHPSQREIDMKHVENLKNDFERKGILRRECPGVVIGLGAGWLNMKNTGPVPYRITNSSLHLHRLSLSPNGPIGQVIRGGHRTEAIRHLSRLPDQSQENYWFYEVLIPGKLLFLLY